MGNLRGVMLAVRVDDDHLLRIHLARRLKAGSQSCAVAAVHLMTDDVSAQGGSDLRRGIGAAVVRSAGRRASCEPWTILEGGALLALGQNGGDGQ